MVALIGSELVVPRPADELTSAIGLDFFRERVVAARFFQQIDGVFNRLTIKQILRDHITRIIIQIADDKDFFVVRHDEIQYIDMPQFMGRAPFEEPHWSERTPGGGCLSPLTAKGGLQNGSNFMSFYRQTEKTPEDLGEPFSHFDSDGRLCVREFALRHTPGQDRIFPLPQPFSPAET